MQYYCLYNYTTIENPDKLHKKIADIQVMACFSGINNGTFPGVSKNSKSKGIKTFYHYIPLRAQCRENINLVSFTGCALRYTRKEIERYLAQLRKIGIKVKLHDYIEIVGIAKDPCYKIEFDFSDLKYYNQAVFILDLIRRLIEGDNEMIRKSLYINKKYKLDIITSNMISYFIVSAFNYYNGHNNISFNFNNSYNVPTNKSLRRFLESHNGQDSTTFYRQYIHSEKIKTA
jgi:hypothetical protein